MHINIPAQPDEVKLQTSQKEQLKKLRESNIIYTVLGQRIVFSAISRYLLRIKSEYRIPAILDAIAKSIEKMYNSGFLDRNASHWKNIIIQPNEKLTMITTGSGGEKCIDLLRMIFLNSSEGVHELINRVRDEVDNEVNWTVSTLANWRKEFFVELPEVKLSYSESLTENALIINNENSLIGSLLDASTEEEDEENEANFDEGEDENEVYN